VNGRSTRVAVDIGGTFTDLVFLEEETGRLGFEKTDTTPNDPAAGVMTSFSKGGPNLGEVGIFIHGTTLGLNALLEHKVSSAALITTRGFRDVLEIGRLSRPLMYDIVYRKPPPLIPRRLRREVTERMNFRGQVLVPLDEGETRRVVRSLAAMGIRVFAVCFLHSYANPAHELRVGEIIREECSEAYVSLSHQILQQFYEYERTVSTVINASIQPVVEKYLDRLREELVAHQFSGEFLITRSAGGAMSHSEARVMPLHTVLSGPAGGVQGAAYLANVLQVPNLIAIDAGGTSFDVSLLSNGEPRVRSDARLAGYELLLPVFDLETIGAGGGSIASVDSGNALQVGPQSAGANPGPICYGRGGIQPTVTDAAVCLGLIDPRYFLGGDLHLDVAAARRGIEGQIAQALGLRLEEAASGILSIIEAKMTAAIREMSIARGYDPREFSILAYGGAGPLFATSLARQVGIPRVIVPRRPGNFSAWGMLMFDVVQDFVRSHVVELDRARVESMNEIFAGLEEAALAALARQRVSQEQQLILRSIDVKYVMAGHVINVPVSGGTLVENDREALRNRFNELHQMLYGHQLEDILQVVNFRLRAVGRVRKPTLERIRKDGAALGQPMKGERGIYDPCQRREMNYAILSRESLPAGFRFQGPAILEEHSSTTVLPAGHLLDVDDYGNLIISRETA
jgi:N-methylhydantoinase A